jgi:hypothetical protein
MVGNEIVTKNVITQLNACFCSFETLIQKRKEMALPGGSPYRAFSYLHPAVSFRAARLSGGHFKLETLMPLPAFQNVTRYCNHKITSGCR